MLSPGIPYTVESHIYHVSAESLCLKNYTFSDFRTAGNSSQLCVTICIQRKFSFHRSVAEDKGRGQNLFKKRNAQHKIDAKTMGENIEHLY